MTKENSVKVIRNPKFKRVILLGMDGLDPRLLSNLIGRDELPNFSKLSQIGSFSALVTSNPAQSPVAWASIATGNNPGYHGIFDFLSRRVSDYMPELAITRPNPKNVFGKREAMFLPVMQGKAFWDYTSENGIPTTILKWPMTFQPTQTKARLYAGLGVPDIRGGLGRYSFYTTRDISDKEEGHEKVIKVKREGDFIRTYIAGPDVAKLMSREPAKSEMLIKIINNSEIIIRLDGKETIVQKDKWSRWVEVRFKLGMMKSISGIVKFYLNAAEPEFELYMTPIQVNPREPAFVITSPDEYIKELFEKEGHFYTLGMPEDTKALEEGRIDEDAFITMCDEIIEEQEKILWYELDRFSEGLLACAFFSTDRIQHIFYVTKDPEHPLYDKGYAEKYDRVIDDYYRKMDRILGKLLDSIDGETAIMVFSDHGFTTFRRVVHINSWLVENGFMSLTQQVPSDDKEGGGLFQYVDWKKTYAYAVGFGSIYLNLKGRERNGIVEPDSADSILKKLSTGLKRLKDPEKGIDIVRDVYRCRDIYSGAHVSKAPDLIIGFNDGFRVSWQTAVGGAPPRIIEDNLKKWSGDHIVDPSIVPGILLTNFKINHENPHLMNIAPTVLSCFGISAPDMKGNSLL